MVNKADLQECRRLVNPTSYGLIGAARAGIPRWMVMHQSEAVCSGGNDWPENFAGLSRAFGNRAKTNSMFVFGLCGDYFNPKSQKCFWCISIISTGVLADAGDGDAIGGAGPVSRCFSHAGASSWRPRRGGKRLTRWRLRIEELPLERFPPFSLQLPERFIFVSRRFCSGFGRFLWGQKTYFCVLPKILDDRKSP